jgi:hypothetical protein
MIIIRRFVLIHSDLCEFSFTLTCSPESQHLDFWRDSRRPFQDLSQLELHLLTLGTISQMVAKADDNGARGKFWIGQMPFSCWQEVHAPNYPLNKKILGDDVTTQVSGSHKSEVRMQALAMRFECLEVR